MRHRVAGRKLGRTTEHRIAMMRNMSTSLFDKEKITTTLSKAKELRPFAEKLITLSKKETLHARRLILRQIHDKQIVAKMFDTLSARYAQRPGGYTRIIKLGPRRGDNAEMAIIELVGVEDEQVKEKSKTKGKAAKGSSKAKPKAKPKAKTKAKPKTESDESAKKKKKKAKTTKKKASTSAKPAKSTKTAKKVTKKSKAAKKD